MNDLHKAAMRQALDELVNLDAVSPYPVGRAAITALREALAAPASPDIIRGAPCEVLDGDPDSPTYKQWRKARFVAPDLIAQEPIVQIDGRMPWFATWRSVRGITKSEALAAPGVPESEREQLRRAQSEAVMPLIGPLLDAWEGLPNDVACDEELGAVRLRIKDISRAMLAAAPQPKDAP